MQVRKTRDPISHFRDKIVAAELANEDEIKVKKIGKGNWIRLPQIFY